MTKKVFCAGDVIFKEGELGRNMYEVLGGCVEVFSGYGTEAEKKLVTLGEGKIFGEMALLEYYPRSATVVCAADGTELLEISDGELNDFLKEEPAQIKNIMISLSSRLRELTADYHEVCGTIRDMRDTGEAKENRGSGLLGRIARFLKLSKDAEAQGYEKQKTASGIALAPDKSGYGQKKWKKGQVIFREGDPADCMYYVAYGTVDIFTGYGTENQNLLTSLYETKFFGEMGLLENKPRSATAVAASDEVVAVVYNEADFDGMVEKSPVMLLMALQHLSARLRNLTEDYLAACRTLREVSEAEEEDAGLTDEQLARVEMFASLATMHSYIELL